MVDGETIIAATGIVQPLLGVLTKALSYIVKPNPANVADVNIGYSATVKDICPAAGGINLTDPIAVYDLSLIFIKGTAGDKVYYAYLPVPA